MAGAEVQSTSGRPSWDALAKRSNLTAAQLLVWVGQNLSPQTPHYNMVQTYEISGIVDPKVFVSAWECVVQQTDVLRTTIKVDNGVPFQSVKNTICTQAELIDLSDQPDPRQAYESWLERRKQKQLFLDVCLYDCVLIQLAPHQFVWYLCQHHLICDGTSFALTYQNLANAYEQVMSDATDVVSYPQFQAHVEYEKQNPLSQKTEQFWLQKGSQKTSTPRFYGNHVNVAGYQTQRVTLELDASVCALLNKTLETEAFESLSFNLAHTAMWCTLTATLVHHVTGEAQIRIGVPYEARPRKTDKQTQGMFTEIGVIEASFNAETTFASLYREILDQSLDNLRHLQSGISNSTMSGSYHVLVNCVSSRIQTFNGHPVDVKWHSSGYADQNLALQIQVCDFQGSDQSTLYIDLNQDHFPAPSDQWLIDHLMCVIHAFTEQPSRPVGDVTLASDEQLSHRDRFNATQTPPTRMRSVTEFLEQTVRMFPDAIAIKEGDTQLTYHQLNQAANQFATHLIKQGVNCGDRVALFAGRSTAAVVAIWGTLKAGAAFVPIDCEAPEQRQRMLIEDLQPSCVLTLSQDVWIHQHPNLAVIQWQDVDWQTPVDSPQRDITPTALAYLIYTSGSTGMPKAVMVTHQNLVNYLSWAASQYLGDQPLDFALCSSLAFDLTITSLFLPAVAGSAMKIYAKESNSAFDVLDVFADDAVDVVKLTPSHLAMVHAQGTQFSRIKTLILGGELLRTDLARNVVNHLNNDLAIYNEYGPTEATVGCMVHRYSLHADVDGAVPIGRPADNTQVQVLGPYGQQVPDGVVGEITLQGLGVAHGYWNRAALTSERFSTTPSGRTYRTGDLGRWNAQGHLELLGRKDDQVKFRGIRIELAEIEAIAMSFPHIHECAAIVHTTNPNTIQATQNLVLYYVSDEELPPEDLRSHMASLLSNSVVPSHYIWKCEFPLNQNGKLDRNALVHNAIASSELATPYVEPNDPTSRKLVEIWETYLDHRPIGVHHNYLAMGGDSVTCVQIAAAAQANGIDLLPLQILEHPTIYELASLGLDKQTKPLAAQNLGGLFNELDETQQVVFEHQTGVSYQEAKSDVYPLTPVQKGILFHYLVAPDSQSYVGQVSCDLTGEIDEQRLRNAWQTVVNRHDVLRTKIIWRGLAEPHQFVLPVHKHEWRVEDLRNEIDPLGSSQRMERILAETPLNLEDSPPFRMTLLHIAEQKYRLIWNTHHVLLDGWSAYPLFEELMHAYEGDHRIATRQAPPPFKSYVAWQRQQSGTVQQDFWKTYLSGFDTPTRLPTSQRTSTTPSSQVITLTFDENETQLIQQLGKSCHVSTNCIFQTAWALLLSRYCDQTDVVHGTTFSGRSGDLEGMDAMVGILLNTLPVRHTIDESRSVADWLSDAQSKFVRLNGFESTSLNDIQNLQGLGELFDSILVFENYPTAINQPSATLKVGTLDIHAPSHYALAVLVYPETPIRCEFVYKTNHHSERSVQRISKHLHAIVIEMCRSPHHPISRIRMLSEAEIGKVRATANKEAGAAPPSVNDIVRGVCASTPDAVAVQSSQRVISYAEMNGAVEVLAEELTGLGVGRGQLVAIEAERTPESIIAMLAVWRIGCAFLPIDPTVPDARGQQILNDARPNAVVHANHAQNNITLCKEWTPAQFNHEVAYVLYTSGSTGSPKGVVVSHSALGYSTDSRMSYYPTRAERFLMLSPFFFDSSMAGLWWTLCQGGALILPDLHRERELAHLLELIDNHAVTHLLALPSLYDALVTEAAPRQLQSLTTCVVAGEVVHTELHDRHLSKAPNAKLFNEYGPTEATVWSHVYELTQNLERSANVPIGKPVRHATQLILDSTMRPVPTGVIGELYLGGPGLADGYIADYELSATKFIDAPQVTGAKGKFYRTGDRVRENDNGDLEFITRTDNQIKRRGYRIEPAEIESVISQHVAVKEASVLATDERPIKLVAAFIADEAIEELIVAWCKDQLPLHMQPDRIVQITQFPKLANGKTDLQALKKVVSSASREQEYVAPVSEQQRLVAAIWQDLFNRERVGLKEDFLALGGDSITAMQFAARLFNSNWSVDLQLVLDGRSLQEIADQLTPNDMISNDTTSQPFEMADMSKQDLDELLEDF